MPSARSRERVDFVRVYRPRKESRNRERRNYRKRYQKHMIFGSRNLKSSSLGGSFPSKLRKRSGNDIVNPAHVRMYMFAFAGHQHYDIDTNKFNTYFTAESSHTGSSDLYLHKKAHDCRLTIEKRTLEIRGQGKRAQSVTRTSAFPK